MKICLLLLMMACIAGYPVPSAEHPASHQPPARQARGVYVADTLHFEVIEEPAHAPRRANGKGRRPAAAAPNPTKRDALKELVRKYMAGAALHANFASIGALADT